MPRVGRIVIPGCAHHVTQRGNNRQDVFFVRDDYRTYLAILGEQSRRYGLQVHAYCLMTNHVHLVATPRSGQSLAKAVGRTHWLYTQTINRLHGRSGHLWQNRFYSCALDGDHYWAAIRYAERNPVRARLHRKAWLYPYSSAAAHVAKTGTAAPLAVPALSLGRPYISHATCRLVGFTVGGPTGDACGIFRPGRGGVRPLAARTTSLL